MFNPLKLLGGLIKVEAKVEGVADQVQDKQAERRWALAGVILAAGIAAALIIWAIRGC